MVILAVDDDALVLMNTADAGRTRTWSHRGQFGGRCTDQAMPRMTGAELAGAIKADWPNLPIIIATGYAQLSEDAGGDLQRTSKPFTQTQLTEAVSAETRSRSWGGKVVEFFRSTSRP